MARKITVISTNSAAPKSFNTEASTVGDLKKDMVAQGISIDDMDFLEANSKTCLTNDQSTLPSQIEKRGELTDDLVIMLSTSNKRIRSGVLSHTRKSTLTKAKQVLSTNPNMSGEFGNITRKSTFDLNALILKAERSEGEGNKNPMAVLVTTLHKNGMLSMKQKEEILNLI